LRAARGDIGTPGCGPPPSSAGGAAATAAGGVGGVSGVGGGDSSAGGGRASRGGSPLATGAPARGETAAADQVGEGLLIDGLPAPLGDQGPDPESVRMREIRRSYGTWTARHENIKIQIASNWQRYRSYLFGLSSIRAHLKVFDRLLDALQLRY